MINIYFQLSIWSFLYNNIKVRNNIEKEKQNKRMQFFVIDELYGKVQDKGWRGRSRWGIHQNIKILFWNKWMKDSKSTMIVVYRIKPSSYNNQ